MRISVVIITFNYAKYLRQAIDSVLDQDFRRRLDPTCDKKFFADHGIEHRELNIGHVHIRYQLIPYLLKRHRYIFVYGRVEPGRSPIGLATTFADSSAHSKMN